jgi:hypothetical protein
MDSVSEGQVTIWAASNVESMRFGKLCRVSVGSALPDGDYVPTLNFDPGDPHVFRR